MGWTDLLQNDQNERLSAPWIGGRSVRLGPRSWSIYGKLPREYGWFEFALTARKAKWVGNADPQALGNRVVGYLVGDRLAPDDGGAMERVQLIESGLDRFARISAGRAYEGGPLIFQQQEMPLGPEAEVLDFFLDGCNEIDRHFKGATPALYSALKLEIYHRVVTERRRAELERLRREEEERLAKEQRRKQLVEQLGDGAGRRAMAREDFGEAAKAALMVGGAELLDVRNGQRGEKVVRYRLDGQRFECVCDAKTMQVIDAGVCLTAHNDDDGFEEGTKGDSFFTLESLPSVVRQAQRERRLVIYRHA